jgi:DNA-binding response OmpR family regulator
MDRKRNILVVDDSETKLGLLEAVLGDEKFKVTTALSAKEAYEILEDSIPDLILLDLLMPNENGFDVIKKLQLVEKYKRIPIIIVTAFANEENTEKANKYGVYDVIEKPIDIPEFLNKVNNALNLTEEIA